MSSSFIALYLTSIAYANQNQHRHEQEHQPKSKLIYHNMSCFNFSFMSFIFKKQINIFGRW